MKNTEYRMKILISILLFWVSESYGKYWKSTNTPLSTFRTEALKIRAPVGCNSTFEEVMWIMRSYFIHNNRYTDNDWNTLEREFSSQKDHNTVIICHICIYNL